MEVCIVIQVSKTKKVRGIYAIHFEKISQSQTYPTGKHRLHHVSQSLPDSYYVILFVTAASEGARDTTGNYTN